MSPASPHRSGSSPYRSAYARIAASTASMCFRSESLAVYSCIRARAEGREGREDMGMEGWKGGERKGREQKAESREQKGESREENRRRGWIASRWRDFSG